MGLGTRDGDYKGMCSALLRCVNQDFSRVQLGNTMVLYRAEEHRVLELLRNLCLERVLPVAQRLVKSSLCFTLCHLQFFNGKCWVHVSTVSQIGLCLYIYMFF